MSAVAVDRALAARLLAHWWSRPVPEEVAAWHEAWLDAADMARSLGRAGSELVPLAASSTADGGDMLAEYERLFVGPGRVPCPPYEALWQDDGKRLEQGRLMSTATAAVTRVYRSLDLAMRRDAHELPDHLVIELEALAYALGEDEEAANELLVEHLLRWVPKLAAAVEGEAELEFYRLLARLTPGWLAAIAEPEPQ
jgi:TorA maturation chaperone TorD